MQTYLHKTTLESLSSTSENVLITKHLDKFYAEFPNLLDADRIEDLLRMYQLVSDTTWLTVLINLL